VTVATITDNTTGTYTGCEDTWTGDGANHGSATTINGNSFGDENTELAFSGLSNIPSNATVSAVTLRIYFTEFGGAGNCIFQRITSSWVEGSVTATPTAAAASATLAHGTSTPGYVDFSAAGLVTDVQNWVSGANSNYGWLITESSSYFIAASSEGTNGQRPELVVTYTTPGGAASPVIGRRIYVLP
jgi:hypothetical protein